MQTQIVYLAPLGDDLAVTQMLDLELLHIGLSARYGGNGLLEAFRSRRQVRRDQLIADLQAALVPDLFVAAGNDGSHLFV